MHAHTHFPCSGATVVHTHGHAQPQCSSAALVCTHQHPAQLHLCMHIHTDAVTPLCLHTHSPLQQCCTRVCTRMDTHNHVTAMLHSCTQTHKHHAQLHVCLHTDTTPLQQCCACVCTHTHAQSPPGCSDAEVVPRHTNTLCSRAVRPSPSCCDAVHAHTNTSCSEAVHGHTHVLQ